VVLTNGHWYSLVCRSYPKFNQPLFSIVTAITNKGPKAIKVVDVGAAVGDTVLFLEANFPGKIENYLTIDGDTQFFSLQSYNLKSINNKCISIFSLLSGNEELINTIEKHDPTTGNAIGKRKEMCKTLDQVLLENDFESPDLIKIDIDGFDGKAILGAIKTLKSCKPFVIFERSPPDFNLVGNNIYEPFEVLTSCDYDRFIWFTNLGEFSHIEFGFDRNSLRSMEKYCNMIHKVNGHHFDVIALHKNHQIIPEDIAFINQTVKQKSPY
jgi:FkbM family methyltransferase